MGNHRAPDHLREPLTDHGRFVVTGRARERDPGVHDALGRIEQRVVLIGNDGHEHLPPVAYELLQEAEEMPGHPIAEGLAEQRRLGVGGNARGLEEARQGDVGGHGRGDLPQHDAPPRRILGRARQRQQRLGVVAGNRLALYAGGHQRAAC